MRRPRTLLLLSAAAGTSAALALTAPPAVAHDGEHGGGGQQGPTISSKNVKLLGNLDDGGNVRQSDLAFDGTLAYAGNYAGFRVIDVSDPEAPREVSKVTCNGPQGDVSVYRGLVFQSVDNPQSSAACNSTTVTAATPGMFEGVRIFDASNPAAPTLIRGVQTDCGSHTHTLVPDPAKDRVLVYVSSYPLGGAALGPDCQSHQTGDGHGKVSIIDVPLSDPAGATVSEYHLDAGTEVASYNLGPRAGTFDFTACHDISVNTAIGRAAAACLSEAQIWDISDPAQPRFLARHDDPVLKTENIDLWHSASFSWDGKVVAFGDESGGGGAARCADPTDRQGRIHFVDLKTMEQAGRTGPAQLLADYKVPRAESGTCTMHNFNFLPLRDGRKVLVSSAYTAGTTFVDVDKLIATKDSAKSEIGFYRAHATNTWSSYWYNGHGYGNDERGLDIYLLSDRARAGEVRLPYLNPQTQEQLIG
jgi:hypothetical protein